MGLFDLFRKKEKLLFFREQILKAGFREARADFRQFNFYRNTNEKAFFIINLRDCGESIKVTYGFSAISDEEFLKNYGENDCDIKLRYTVTIKNETDEETAASEIKRIFDLYCSVSKDEILALRKAKQKEFLEKITNKLKPAGFKKKGAKWIKVLDGDFCLEFNAQKSQWSDEYYFNISIYHSKIICSQCYGTRLNINKKGIYDWQLITDEELNRLLNFAYENMLLPIINTPLTALGRRREVWAGCTCKRDKCESCWVQRNLWEAKSSVKYILRRFESYWKRGLSHKR